MSASLPTMYSQYITGSCVFIFQTMRTNRILLGLLILMGCQQKKAEPDRVLPAPISELANNNDSLVKVKARVLHFANLYVNDMNNKMNEDSMEYWSAVEKGMLERNIARQYLLDSTNRMQK